MITFTRDWLTPFDLFAVGQRLITSESGHFACSLMARLPLPANYDFPPERWKSIRTTNILERAFREVRRRTWSMNNCCAHEASSDRNLYGITQMLDKNWGG